MTPWTNQDTIIWIWNEKQKGDTRMHAHTHTHTHTHAHAHTHTHTHTLHIHTRPYTWTPDILLHKHTLVWVKSPKTPKTQSQVRQAREADLDRDDVLLLLWTKEKNLMENFVCTANKKVNKKKKETDEKNTECSKNENVIPEAALPTKINVWSLLASPGLNNQLQKKKSVVDKAEEAPLNAERSSFGMTGKIWKVECDTEKNLALTWNCNVHHNYLTTWGWQCQFDSYSLTVSVWPCRFDRVGLTVSVWRCRFDSVGLTASVTDLMVKRRSW